MIHSANSQVILLLCAYLGFSHQSELTPLSTREWNTVAKRLQANSIEPEALLHAETSWVSEILEHDQQLANRISGLLSRSGLLAIELERLESLGINVITRADESYPKRFKQRLKDSAPALLFYSGNADLMGQTGIAVVGSRNLDEAGKQCAEFIGNACGLSGLVLYSGGARGVDSLSMLAALEARGNAVGILADSLEKAIRTQDYRNYLASQELCLATPYSPSAPFNVGAAMGRNRLIYTLSDYALVIASDFEKGGTWAGAIEALKAKWIPLFALQHDYMPLGNKKLIERGAISFPHPFQGHYSELKAWFDSHSSSSGGMQEQLSLFQ